MLWKVTVWEVMRNLRNRTFLIGLFITPLIIVLFGGLPALIERIDRPREELYVVEDRLGALQHLEGLAVETPLSFRGVEDEEKGREVVIEGRADGFFVLDRELIDTATLTVFAVEQTPALQRLEGMISSFLHQERIAEAGLGTEDVAYITARAEIRPELHDEREARTPVDMVLGIAMGALLLVLIFTSGSMLMQSALQEKRDRMAEIVLSSVGPDELMGGKILGHFLLGMIQIAFWLGLGLPLIWYFFDVPVLDYLSTPWLPVMLFFVLMGYLLYAAIFVGLGATMEDLQSASNSQGLVVTLPILPIFLVGPIINNPGGTVARIGGLFPITSPVVNIFRMGIHRVPAGELILSAVLLLLTVYILSRLAARVFRVGMLMYGKNASPKEIWRWLRYSEERIDTH